MSIKKLSEDIVLVVLPPEPQTSDEIRNINEITSERCDFDVIVDFSALEILTSPSICNLLILDGWLRGAGHQLVFCNVSFTTRGVLGTVGLDQCFRFADDRTAALAALHHAELATT
jgi:anti-anti-sigma regulatory factor